MTEFTLRGKSIWVAGHNGMVGSALTRRLKTEGCDIIHAGRAQLDLRRQGDVEAWLRAHRPHAIFLAAAKVGGIRANSTRPAEFIHDNLSIELNVIEAARQSGVSKLMLLGSSCIYPKLARQPMKEEVLLTGSLEPTNEWYAIAKIAGIKLCQAYRQQYGCDFISVMPTNLYGPGDNFDLEQSHVVPALMRKMHDARVRGDSEIVAWGTGSPRRELLHVEDMADACVYLMKQYSEDSHINIGNGSDLSIREIAEAVRSATGYEGAIRFDPSYPDGVRRKLLDVGRLGDLGWTAKIGLKEGLQSTYEWFDQHYTAARLRYDGANSTSAGRVQ